MLADNPDPTDAEIREDLSGNVCRCTGYQFIVDAVRDAPAIMRGETPRQRHRTRDTSRTCLRDRSRRAHDQPPTTSLGSTATLTAPWWARSNASTGVAITSRSPDLGQRSHRKGEDTNSTKRTVVHSAYGYLV
ncbi:hypothetical protein I4I78_08855 [Pseudonocardia sp. KRD-291]|nr:hypothetical protein [Pseudonocardia sp. KRD291]